MPQSGNNTAPQINPDNLSRLFKVMERLAASSDLQQILSLIIDSMRDALNAERASVFQFDAKTQELFITQAHGAAGVCDDFMLGFSYARTRTMRLGDGPDEVHARAIAINELKK